MAGSCARQSDLRRRLPSSRRESQSFLTPSHPHLGSHAVASRSDSSRCLRMPPIVHHGVLDLTSHQDMTRNACSIRSIISPCRARHVANASEENFHTVPRAASPPPTHLGTLASSIVSRGLQFYVPESSTPDVIVRGENGLWQEPCPATKLGTLERERKWSFIRKFWTLDHPDFALGGTCHQNHLDRSKVITNVNSFSTPGLE